MIFICEVIIRAITALSGYPYLDSYADSPIHDVRWCLMKADSISLSARYIIQRATKFLARERTREVAERVVMCQRYQRSAAAGATYFTAPAPPPPSKPT